MRKTGSVLIGRGGFIHITADLQADAVATRMLFS
jgi:hypothetical protein